MPSNSSRAGMRSGRGVSLRRVQSTTGSSMLPPLLREGFDADPVGGLAQLTPVLLRRQLPRAPHDRTFEVALRAPRLENESANYPKAEKEHTGEHGRK